MRVVNTSVRKKDAMQLVTGQPVYVDDLAPQDCLIVKLLRSPYANAMVKTINTAIAMKVPGIEAIYTWEDVPQDAKRYTQAGQTYPEASPYDRLLIDRHVRFQGDIVAIVAGKDAKCVDKALRLIKVQYEVLEPVLDFHTSKDNPILVHPEDNWESLAPVGADNKRNLCAHDECGNGDVEAVLKDCDIVIDHVYHTKPCQQTDDGDIPYLLFDRYLRKIKYFKFHADRVPLSQNRGKCASYPEVDGAREQAENRRGVWCEADGGL